MKKYPLKLTYTAKTALWAGKRLKEEFGKQSEFDTVSETWELSVRKDEMARIIGGEADGMTLAEYFAEVGYGCVTPSYNQNDRFPLLVKLIVWGSESVLFEYVFGIPKAMIMKENKKPLSN